MRLIKLVSCVISFVVYFFVSLAVFFLCAFMGSGPRRRVLARLVRLFALSLTRILGISVCVTGSGKLVRPLGRGSLCVSNHLSYVDGFVLGSVFPLIYVAKSDLKQWPLIGFMSEIGGTLFVDRQKKARIIEYVGAIAETLKRGTNVLFFPEGTSTNGAVCLPFKSSFFEAAIIARAPILPISLVYKCIDGKVVDAHNRDLIYWYGDMTFAGHFFKLLNCRAIDVEVRVHEPLVLNENASASSLRKCASETARKVILRDIKFIT